MHKNFALTEDKNRNMSINDKPETIRGSSFAIGDIYVDYESSDKDVEITSITKTLLSRNYLKLESQVEI